MPNPPTDLQRLLAAEPDLVDRIFDYVVELIPEIAGKAAHLEAAKAALRNEVSGTMVYVRKGKGSGSAIASREGMIENILSMFDGRNASEVARRLNIGRATVYRVLKQAGSQTKRK